MRFEPTVANLKFWTKILRFDEILYTGLERAFGTIPRGSRPIVVFSILCVVEFGIAAIDIQSGYAISLRPLLFIPIMIAAAFTSRPFTYALAILAALLHVEAFRLSVVPEREPFPFVVNALASLAGALALAEFSSLSINTIRELRNYVDLLLEEVAHKRLAEDDNGAPESGRDPK